MSPSNITIRTILHQATQRLENISDSPRLDAELLLAHSVGKSRSFLYAYSETSLNQEQLDRFGILLNRRCQGEPVAYLVEQKEFWSLDLLVTREVLIPRPETELLVELALTLLPPDHAIQAVDLGTGSGAIALALAMERPYWKIIATDSSMPALKIAQNNAQELALKNLQFIHGGWFTPLHKLKFDLVVSNPPYIDINDPHLAHPTLDYEPHHALVSEDRGLGDIKHIVEMAPLHLLPNGFLILEHGYDQGTTVRNLLKQRGFSTIEGYRDLSGQDRASMAQWNSLSGNSKQHL